MVDVASGTLDGVTGTVDDTETETCTGEDVEEGTLPSVSLT